MKQSYFNLGKEIHRSFLIGYSAVVISSMNFAYKLMTGRSWEEYQAAEAKFKKSKFADKASTGRTMKANPEMADKIAAFAHGG